MTVRESTRQQLEKARKGFADALTSTSVAVAELRAEYEREAARFAGDAERGAEEQEFVEAARAGSLGGDMQRLQERIDRGEFTWEQVVAGQVDDDAATATAMRRLRLLQEGLESGEAPGPDVRADDDFFDDPMGRRR